MQFGIAWPEVIEGTCRVGSPSKIVEQVREGEAAGLCEVGIVPALAGYAA